MTSNTKETSLESKPRILNDYILMDVFKYADIKDLFRWIRISEQFCDCIHRVLKLKNQLMVSDSERYICGLSEYRVFLKVRENSQQNDIGVNNIEFSINKKSNIYYLSESLSALKTISDKCQRINYLALKECYLEETILQFIEENIKQLKVLLLFDCLFPKSRFDMFCEKLEDSVKNVTHLTIAENMKDIEDVSIDCESLMPSFVRSFKNLKVLNVWMKKKITIIRLMKQMPSNIESLKLIPKTSVKLFQNIRNNFCNRLNAQNLKCVDLFYFVITTQTLQTIINSLNLQTFGFSCEEIDCNLLIDLAQKHKELKQLYIYWAKLIGDITTGTTILFENVIAFRSQYFQMTPIQFKQVIRLFPILKKFSYNSNKHIICCQNDQNCQMCENMCFDFIPVIKSLRKLSIPFRCIRKSFLECINRFPNLKHLRIFWYWTTTETKSELNSYDSYFTQIVELLVDFCNENPKKIFKLEIDTELIPFPKFKIPRNLIIFKEIVY